MNRVASFALLVVMFVLSFGSASASTPESFRGYDLKAARAYGQACENAAWHTNWQEWFAGDDENINLQAMSPRCQVRFTYLTTELQRNYDPHGVVINRYFDVINGDGDYLNDWLTHVPARLRFVLVAVGYSNASWIEGYDF